MNENIISSAEVQGGTEGYVKRKQMYVKRQFQQSMLLQSILLTFIVVNVIVMAVFWAIDSFPDLQQLKFYLAFAVATLEIVGFIAIYQLNLKASHRIAGPVFSMERSLGQIENGDLTTKVSLRSTDQFPETAQQLNATVDSVRRRVNKSQYLAAQIRQHPEKAELLSQQLVEELAFFNTTDISEA